MKVHPTPNLRENAHRLRKRGNVAWFKKSHCVFFSEWRRNICYFDCVSLTL